jgi:opacity protein-like surface antigen
MAGFIPKGGNAFFGYSYSNGKVVNGGAIGVKMNGWEGTLEGKFLPWVSGVADFDWHYGGADTFCLTGNCPTVRFHETGSRHSILFGARASTTFGKYRPFGEVLLGFAHQTDAGPTSSTSDMAFAYAVGGGMDYKLLDTVAWRVQADLMHTKLFHADQNDFRVSTGILFRF